MTGTFTACPYTMGTTANIVGVPYLTCCMSSSVCSSLGRQNPTYLPVAPLDLREALALPIAIVDGINAHAGDSREG